MLQLELPKPERSIINTSLSRPAINEPDVKDSPKNYKTSKLYSTYPEPINYGLFCCTCVHKLRNLRHLCPACESRCQISRGQFIAPLFDPYSNSNFRGQTLPVRSGERENRARSEAENCSSLRKGPLISRNLFSIARIFFKVQPLAIIFF